jgi:hypothetical protein
VGVMPRGQPRACDGFAPAVRIDLRKRPATWSIRSGRANGKRQSATCRSTIRHAESPISFSRERCRVVNPRAPCPRISARFDSVRAPEFRAAEPSATRRSKCYTCPVPVNFRVATAAEAAYFSGLGRRKPHFNRRHGLSTTLLWASFQR